MNKQMTPAEIELVQQSFARFAPISDKAALVSPPPRVVAEHQASSGVIATPLRVPSVRQAPEVLLQPHRLHAKTGHRETGLQPHVDAVAVQRELQKLQPRGAVRQRQ